MDCISTDHAPHGAEEKQGGFEKSPFGIVGLETAFALSYTYLVRAGYMSLADLIRHMSLNPANVISVDRGHLSVGAVADLCICNTEAYTINPESFASMGRNTPFGGWEVYGQVEKTMVSGEFVFSK